MYNEYYLSSNDQNVVFQCFDNIESICQATYNFEEEYSDDWNREDLARILESIQNEIDTMWDIVNEKGRNW